MDGWRSSISFKLRRLMTSSAYWTWWATGVSKQQVSLYGKWNKFRFSVNILQPSLGVFCPRFLYQCWWKRNRDGFSHCLTWQEVTVTVSRHDEYIISTEYIQFLCDELQALQLDYQHIAVHLIAVAMYILKEYKKSEPSNFLLSQVVGGWSKCGVIPCNNHKRALKQQKCVLNQVEVRGLGWRYYRIP